MNGLDLILSAATASGGHTPNLWGALGCAVAYAASLFATLDAFADLILARTDAPGGRVMAGVGLKFGSKIAAAAIAVITAAIVLALDQNWFAFTTLSTAFCAVVATGLVILARHARNTSRAAQ